MIPEQIDDDLPGTTKRILDERLPNYCHNCGGEIVLAGGRTEPEEGWYEHIDPVVMCERGCWRDRFTAGVEDGGAEGREYRVAPGAEEWDEFDDVAGWCDIHREVMEKTKDLLLDGRRVRQYKCPECDRETTVTEVDHAEMERER